MSTLKVCLLDTGVGCLCCGRADGISQLYVIKLSSDGSITTSRAIDLWSEADYIAVTAFCWCDRVLATLSQFTVHLYIYALDSSFHVSRITYGMCVVFLEKKSFISDNSYWLDWNNFYNIINQYNTRLIVISQAVNISSIFGFRHQL